MSSADQLPSRILTWLDGQGFPLEFVTANAFRDHGFRVFQGYHYDVTDGAPREVDVYAHLDMKVKDSTIRIGHVVECKWSRKAPWVVFASENARITSTACITQSIADEVGEALLWFMGTDAVTTGLKLFESPNRPGFSARQALTDSRDHVYAAMQGVMSACRAISQTSYRGSVQQQLAFIQIVFPLIVVDGALFEVFYDEAAKTMQAVQRDSVRMHWRGATAWRAHSTVDIVTSDALPTFLDERTTDCRSALGRFAAVVERIYECLEKKDMSPLGLPKQVLPTFFNNLAIASRRPRPQRQPSPFVKSKHPLFPPRRG
jgi:hypothetical protein